MWVLSVMKFYLYAIEYKNITSSQFNTPQYFNIIIRPFILQKYRLGSLNTIILTDVARVELRTHLSSLNATCHYDDVIMGAIASQITSLTIVYLIVYSDADQRKHQSSASLAFVWGIHRGPVNSPHKWPLTRKMFPFDDVIMAAANRCFGNGENSENNGTEENTSGHPRIEYRRTHNISPSWARMVFPLKVFFLIIIHCNESAPHESKAFILYLS